MDGRTAMLAANSLSAVGRQPRTLRSFSSWTASFSFKSTWTFLLSAFFASLVDWHLKIILQNLLEVQTLTLLLNWLWEYYLNVYSVSSTQVINSRLLLNRAENSWHYNIPLIGISILCTRLLIFFMWPISVTFYRELFADDGKRSLSI